MDAAGIRGRSGAIDGCDPPFLSHCSDANAVALALPAGMCKQRQLPASRTARIAAALRRQSDIRLHRLFEVPTPDSLRALHVAHFNAHLSKAAPPAVQLMCTHVDVT